jgi:uncharacterized protein YndB with AHSA1/START domain
MAAPIALAVSINAPADIVSAALSTSTGLASFWTTDSEAEPKVGSVSLFGFGHASLQMRVDELDPGRHIAWTCLSDFPMPPGHWEGPTVTWDLSRNENGQITVLLQHGAWPDALSQADLAASAYTWALILQALKAYAETGKAGPVFAIVTH